jgi:hypothetical protein
MVGIFRKVKQILKFVQQYAPYLDQVVPGLGNSIKSVASIADNIADGSNAVYDDYQSVKNDGGTYNFKRGLNTFFKPTAKKLEEIPSAPTATNILTKGYGGVHPRLELKK